MRSYRAIAKEMIAHQTDGYAAKLVQAFEDLLKIQSQSEAQDSEPLKRIVEMTNKRFRTKLKLTIDTDEPPCCFPLMVNNSHVLTTLQIDFFGQQMGTLREALKNPATLKGSINLKNATLGGDYSNIEMDIRMSHLFTLVHLNARQAAAIFLHEVGHCFFGLEFMFRTARASQLLAALHQVKTGRGDDMTYVHAVDICAERMAKEGLLKTPKDLEALVSVNGDVTTVAYVYSAVWTKLASDFGSNAQAGPNFEALADAFAVRFGLGDALASGLQNLGDHGHNAGFEASMQYIANSLVGPIVGGFIGLAVTGGSPVGLFVGAVIVAELSLFFGGHSDIGIVQTNVYNTPIRRAERIRFGIIDGLKDPKLSKATRDELLRQVKILDAIINNKVDVGNLYDTLANIIFKSRRDAKTAFELEKQIENLAGNSLFVGANALKSAA